MSAIYLQFTVSKLLFFREINKLTITSMQFSLAQMLLHRPCAGFGCDTMNDLSMQSRRTCVYHASQISRFLNDYEEHHGVVSTMLGSALYTISTAATTLIADIAAQQSEEDKSLQSESLRRCIRALYEMEMSERTANKIRKIIQVVMKVCNLKPESGGCKKPEDTFLKIGSGQIDLAADTKIVPMMNLDTLGLTDVPMLEEDLFSIDDFMKDMAQGGSLESFEPFLSTHKVIEPYSNGI